MTAFKIIFTILFAIIIAIFAVKNMDMVEVSFYDFELNSHNIRVPLLIVVLFSLGAGILVTWVGGVFSQLKLRAMIRHQRKTIDSLSEEIKQLKVPSLPEHTGNKD